MAAKNASHGPNRIRYLPARLCALPSPSSCTSLQTSSRSVRQLAGVGGQDRGRGTRYNLRVVEHSWVRGFSQLIVLVGEKEKVTHREVLGRWVKEKKENDGMMGWISLR